MARSLRCGRGASFLLAIAGLVPALAAQTPAPAPPASLFQDFRWRNIGPANMAGRVTDIEAVR